MRCVCIWTPVTFLNRGHELRAKYKMLKLDIKTEAHDLKLKANKAVVENDVFRKYKTAMIAASEGFTARSNDPIDERMYSSVNRAYLGLTQDMDLDGWKRRGR